MSPSRAAFYIFLICSLGGSYQAPAKAQSNPSARIEALVQQYVLEEDFRGAVLVAKDGEIIHRAAYGYADESGKKPNAPNTSFLIGSLTKSFVAVTIMQLVEDGKLHLHAPIFTYIPKLKPALGRELTLHLLLKHQSGLPEHLERLVSFEEKPVSSSEILQIINTASLAFEPGSQYQYSNLNYHLAAIAIENVTGKSFSQVLHERTFAPLNMVGSGVERFSHVPPRAKGYRNGMFGAAQDENNVSYALGSGDIFSTIDDLFAWDQALFGNKLLSAQSKKLLFLAESSDRGSYGYGFRIHGYRRAPEVERSGILVRHGGSMDGFLSNLHHYTEDELTVIVLANIRPFPIRNLTYELKELALGVAIRARGAKIEE